MIDSKNPITDGKTSYSSLTGSALDNQMVIIEQNKLQTYIDKYKLDFINSNGQQKWDDMAGEISKLFRNSFLRRFTPEANKYAYSEFQKRFGYDTKFDFLNKDHRIFQGQKMAEFLRTKSEEQKTDETNNP